MSDSLPIHPPAEAPERPHAERSASQLKSLALCAGFIPDKTPKKEEHWVTQQGIRGHDALQHDDMGELQSSYEERLAQACEDYCQRLPAAREELKEVRVETIEGRWGYFDRLRFRDESYTKDFVDFDSRSVTPGWATHADLVDYKFVKVKKPEDAELALQGKDYVIGIFNQYPYLQFITVHFLAPRFNFATYHTFSREDLPRITLEVFAVLTQARKTDRKRCSAKLFRPHYETCRFCGRKATCSALRKIATAVANKYLEAGATPIPEVPHNVHASQTDDPEILGRIKLLHAVLEPWCKAVNHHLLNKVLDEGKKVEGYKIGYRKGRRTLERPLSLLSIGPKYGIEMADVLEAAQVSVAQLEDVVMAKAPNGKKEATKNAFLDELRDQDALTRGNDAPTLVRDNEESEPDQV